MKNIDSPLRRLLTSALFASAIAFCIATELNAQTSSKVITQFSPQDWKTSADNRAPAQYAPLDNAGMEVQIAYSGKGFEYHRMENKSPITIEFI